MNRYILVLAFALGTCAYGGYADEAVEPEMAPRFTLEDQHQKSHTLQFPRKRPLVLSIADPGGARDAPVWTNAIKPKYGERIRFWSMANLQFIPAAGRGMARQGIKLTSETPILCDWDGAVAASFKAEKGKAHIIVMSHTGEILCRASGKAEKEKLDAVLATIDAAIEKSLEDVSDE